ncbi:hypothetical protein [Paractinoplanes deccanensis]|nr:hypothetical protein [Actinoplanes deccanensis]
MTFEDWLAYLAGAPEADFDLLDNMQLQNWLQTVYRENGAATLEWVHKLMFEQRKRLAEDLVRELKPHAESDVGPLEDLSVLVPELPGTDFPSGIVTVGDVAIRGLDPAEAGLEVADGVQTFIADTRYAVWPLCPVHRLGLHPHMRDSRPSWVCSQKSHVVSTIYG